MLTMKDIDKQVFDLKKGLLRQQLAEGAWCISHTAKQIGVHRKTLENQMRKFGIRRPQGMPVRNQYSAPIHT